MRETLKVFLFFCLIAFLSSCTSSNKLAFSFSKRKYTKGHFSDAIKKVKVDNKTYVYNSSIINLNRPLNKELKKAIVSKTNIIKHMEFASANRIGIVKVPIISNNRNTYLKINLMMPAYPDNDPHSTGHHSKASKYLLSWLICLGVALISYFFCLELALGTSSSTSAIGASIILGYFSVVALLVALVFFILWLSVLPQYEDENENK
jgi:hypothetical protein